MLKVLERILNHVKSRSLLAFLFSLLYVFIPWTELRVGSEFGDIFAYLGRIDLILNDSDSELAEVGSIRFLTQEPLWAYILTLIGNYFDEPINGFLLVSFFCIFTYSLFLFWQINILAASFVLLNPMVIDLVMMQVRSALALALCLNALMVRSLKLALILIVMASLIHSVTFILLIVYFYAKTLEKNQNSFDYKLLRLSALLLAILLAFLLGDAREAILGAIGDRRAVYSKTTSSFLFLSYWLLLGIALTVTHKRNGFVEFWGDYCSIVLLVLPFLMAIFSTNGMRFVAFGILIVFPTIVTREKSTRMCLIGSFFCYQIMQYIYWTGII